MVQIDLKGFFWFCSEPVPHCLSHVKLIPPCDRILLEMTFCELSKWAIYTLRSSLLEADLYFKQKGINPTLNYNVAVKVFDDSIHLMDLQCTVKPVPLRPLFWMATYHLRPVFNVIFSGRERQVFICVLFSP